jgi:hypothetical protein
MSSLDMLKAIEASEALVAKVNRLVDRLVLRVKRMARRATAARERENQIILYNRYECVGGPYDGESVIWKQPELTMYVVGGTYSLARDSRLHYEHLEGVPFGGDDPEC